MGDAADLGVMPELVAGGATVAAALAQRLQRNVQPDLVAVLEAVGNGLGDRVHADRDAIDGVDLDAFS